MRSFANAACPLRSVRTAKTESRHAIVARMTGEGKALDAGDLDASTEWARRKEAANLALAECSQKYNEQMRELREAGW